MQENKEPHIEIINEQLGSGSGASVTPIPSGMPLKHSDEYLNSQPDVPDKKLLDKTADMLSDAKQQYTNTEGSLSFDKIGLLEARGGVLFLRGRHGERDHVYPIERAIKRYYKTRKVLKAFALYGIRGWDTLKDVLDDMRAKILETIEQKREFQIVPSDFELKFETYEKLGIVIPTTLVVDGLKDSSKNSKK